VPPDTACQTILFGSERYRKRDAKRFAGGWNKLAGKHDPKCSPKDVEHSHLARE
jgi:hypothetical protein